MKRFSSILFIFTLLASGSAGAGWLVKSAPDAAGQTVRCLLESEKMEIFDGYQNVPIYLVLGASTVTVKSVSVLDASFSDIGMQVDKDAFIPMDKLIQDKSASFDSHYATIVDEFKRGIKLNVQLRFWPTWPATGTHAASFSLIGFTKAYTEFSACK